jgi:tRNA 2-selenouridine synthase
MKDSIVLTVDEVVDRLGRFDDVLDARSPDEYRIDRLPGAISTPVLDDRERAEVGTLYKQQSGFEAKRVGAALVARNIATLLETTLADKARDWTPLIYCWRGGNRSGSLATVLTRIGWRCHLLAGGYKAFRGRVLSDLNALPLGVPFIVLAGRTGSAKSEILKRLRARGEQVLDLEALAEHRGSVLGAHPERDQPAQRQFETRLWTALRGFDPSRPVWVESESRRIGTCHQPEALIQAIRSAPCAILDGTRAVRTEVLLEAYHHLTLDTKRLVQQLERLIPIHGHAQIAAWIGLIRAESWDALVDSLLEVHYDPSYDRSMRVNFARFSEAPIVTLAGASPDALDSAAMALIEARRDTLGRLAGPGVGRES